MPLLSVLGVGVGLAFMAASGWMNFIFMTGVARAQADAIALGGLSIAVTLANGLLPFFLRRAWDACRRFAFLIGSVIFTLCLTLSLLSAFGFASQNRGAVVGGRDSVSEEYESAKSKHDDLQRRLSGLGSVREVGLIEGDIGVVKQDRLWSLSRECTEAATPSSRTLCKRFESLQGELKTARQMQELRGELGQLSVKMAGLRKRGAGLDSDPQASLISRVFGVRRADVQMGWEALIAVLLELGAAFFPYLAAPEAGWHARRSEAGRGKAEVLVEVEAASDSRWLELAKKNGWIGRD
jgi:hypothetical protein